MGVKVNINSVEELLDFLRQAANHNTPAHIWTKDVRGNIVLNEKVEIAQVRDGSLLEIKFPYPIKIEVGMDLLFALEEGILVFKSRIIAHSNTSAILSVPMEATGIERRRSPRTPFKFEDRIDLEMQVQSKALTAYLLDLSLHGMCLTFSEETVKDLKVEQVISILRANKGIEFKKCIVKNMRVYKHATLGRSKIYAVGLEFVRD